jgi:hypothetical protein
MVAPPVAPTATSLVMNRSDPGALRSERSARIGILFPRPLQASRENDRPTAIADESCTASRLESRSASPLKRLASEMKARSGIGRLRAGI